LAHAQTKSGALREAGGQLPDDGGDAALLIWLTS
jgi:hypothetical protein